VERPRILAVSEVTEGGVKRHLEDLLSNITIFDVVLAAPKPLNVPCEFVKIDLKRTPKRFLKGTLQLLRLIHKIRPDVLHLHSSIAGAAGRLLKMLGVVKCPVVYTPHCFAFTYEQNPVKERFFRLAESHFAPFTNALICVSESEAAVARLIGIPSFKICVIPIGIAVPPVVDRESRFKARSKIAVEAGKCVIGTLGRLNVQKAPLDFVKMLALVCREEKNAYGVWVGDGPLRKQVESLAAVEGVSDRLFITGWRTDAVQLSHAFDVFVLSSISEGMPRSLLEAAGTGLPCVATDVAGVRDVIRDGVEGFVVPSRDPRALAEKILILIRNPDLRRRMGQAARERVAKHFSLEQMVQKTQDLYLRLLKQRCAPSP